MNKRELDLAIRLINSMKSTWQPSHYKDDYRETLMKWIEKKAKKGGAHKMSIKEEEVMGSMKI